MFLVGTVAEAALRVLLAPGNFAAHVTPLLVGIAPNAVGRTSASGPVPDPARATVP